MDKSTFEWFLNTGYVEMLDEWYAEYDGVICKHYKIKSIREGAWGNVAYTDIYVTLADGLTYDSFRITNRSK